MLINYSKSEVAWEITGVPDLVAVPLPTAFLPFDTGAVGG